MGIKIDIAANMQKFASGLNNIHTLRKNTEFKNSLMLFLIV